MKTKKYLVSLVVMLSIFSFGLLGGAVLPAQAATKVVWAASGTKELYKIKNTTVRKAYKTKVEKYALRNKIKTITGSVVKGMHE